tara:strand:- start:5042 stop:5317 length:276 start_codon:yes stop_codon:yes gene_type:complete
VEQKNVRVLANCSDDMNLTIVMVVEALIFLMLGWLLVWKESSRSASLFVGAVLIAMSGVVAAMLMSEKMRSSLFKWSGICVACGCDNSQAE